MMDFTSDNMEATSGQHKSKMIETILNQFNTCNVATKYATFMLNAFLVPRKDRIGEHVFLQALHDTCHELDMSRVSFR